MNKKTLLPIILLIFSFIIIGCGNSAADTVIIGTIYTSEADQKMVSAVAIKDGVYK